MKSTVASSNVEKATLLNLTLATNFNHSVHPLSPSNIHIFQANPSSPISDEVLCVEDDIFCLLNAIDVRKASGPDGISGNMLKGTVEAITPTVTHLFNLSLKSGKVPEAWKTSSVVPIPKTHRPSDSPIDYRSISLLCTVSKLLEMHVYKLLWQHLNANGLVSDSQWGFCPSRSTVTALLSTFHAIFQLLEKGSDVCLIFFDLRKAFDSVPHAPLLQHLKDIGLNSHILQWISSYLCCRKQYVVVEGASSSTTSVPSLHVASHIFVLYFLSHLYRKLLTGRCNASAPRVLHFSLTYCLLNHNAICGECNGPIACYPQTYIVLFQALTLTLSPCDRSDHKGKILRQQLCWRKMSPF